MEAARAAAVGAAAATSVSVAIGLSGTVDTISWMPPVLRVMAAAGLVVPALTGTLLLWRRPTAVVAWLMLLGPFLFSLQMPFALALGDGWAHQLDRALWPLLYAWPVAVAYVFPDGRFLSRSWRWPAGLGALGVVGLVVTGILDRHPFLGGGAGVPNPVARSALARSAGELGLDRLFPVFVVAMLVGLGGGAAAVVVRLRRASGVERAQTRWLAWSASLFPILLLLCAASSLLLGDSVVDLFLLPVILLAPVAIALSVAVAVRRHHLWAIDRIIPVTALWATLTTVLLVVYAAVAALLGVLLGARSPWVTALATMVVALAFVPLRRRVQSLVDRRFARARHEGVRLVRAFEDEVRAGRRDPEGVVEVLALALGDPSVGIRFRLPGSGTLGRPLRCDRGQPAGRRAGDDAGRQAGPLGCRPRALTGPPGAS